MSLTPEQLSILIEFMERHGDIGNNLVQSPHFRLRRQQLWSKLVVMLNQVGYGPKKPLDKWIKTWVDLKHRAKKKQMLVNEDINGTGGGLRRQSSLTEYEHRILKIMGLETGTTVNSTETTVTQRRRQRRSLSQTENPLDKAAAVFADMEEKRIKLEEDRHKLDVLREKNFHERQMLDAQIRKDSIAVQQQLVAVLNKFLENVNNK